MADRSKEILIVAGERSGDLHGASLVRELMGRDRDLTFFGIGGDAMGEAGVELLEHADRMAVVGFTEVVGKYLFLRSVFRRTLRQCEWRKPVRAILIDYPGFNLTLARRLTGMGIPVTYFIPPQVWAWRETRVEALKRHVDQILCIFPFEPEWYARRGVTVTFVGHPLLDDEEGSVTEETFRSRHGLKPEVVTVGLMPGSRQHEVNRHLPVMVEAVRRLRHGGYAVQAVIGKGRGVELERVDRSLCSVEEESPQLVLRFAELGVVASGTATLEGALYGTPCVVVYRMSPLSWEIGRRLARVDFVSLPNLIAGREVFPELLQRKATGEQVESVLKRWIDSPARRERVMAELDEVRGKLGTPGAAGRAAALIVEKLGRTVEIP